MTECDKVNTQVKQLVQKNYTEGGERVTSQVRDLIEALVYSNNLSRNVKDRVMRVLESDTSARDAIFRDTMRNRLERIREDSQKKISGLATVEDPPMLDMSRFLPTKADLDATRNVIDARKIADTLARMNVHYMPSILLHGSTGCGKTTFARFLAVEAKLPFVMLKLSNVVDSLLGQTDKNIATVFDYAAQEPCVLCLDEIDALALRRGQEDSTGAISRATITLMQQLDQMPNDTIIVATTNRFDDLDPAFVRRFTIQHEVKPLSHDEAKWLVDMFFDRTLGYVPSGMPSWPSGAPAYAVINRCTEELIRIISNQ